MNNNELVIEIVAGHEAVQTRMVQGKPRFSQKAYAHLGGAFPHEIRVPVEDPQRPYRVGRYNVALNSYQVGKYGDLQINPFEFVLVPAGQASAVKAAS